MSSAPTQLAVAPTASNLVSSTAQIQKDYLEEPLARQNSLGNRVRGGLKGKHLTRSHAMRESASPPRTPTPRSSEQQQQLAQSPVSTSYSSSSETINDSNNKMHVQSSSLSTSPSSLETPSVIVTSQHSQQQQQQQQQQQIHSSNDNNNMNFGVVCNQSQLDLDFPKLTPPKSSKCPRNRDQSQSSDKQQQLNANTIDYNNKLAFNNSTGISGGGNNNLSLVDSISTTGSSSSSNTSYNNKNGNKMNNDNLITKSSSTSSNGQNMMNNHIQNVSQINWNRQNSPPIEQQQQQTGGINSNSNNSPPHMTHNDNNNKDNRCCPRIESQNSSNSGTFSIDDNQSESPTDGSKCSERLNKKHKSGANSKSSKPRLKNMGSSSSVEGGNSTSGFISRDSSTEQFTDQSGVDLVQFFKETLNKNPKDRSMLMKIEKDLLELAHDNSRTEIKFPAMSSYNRMLIHRVAAFFGMEHNVDATTQQCVIVATTKSTRIPDIRFKSLFRERLSDEPPRRSILKRDTHSFEDPRQSFLMCPDNRGILDRKAKSFEEREEEYEKARRRIFKRDGHNDMNNAVDEQHHSYWPWSSSESSDQSARMRHQQHNNKLLKVHSLSDGRQDGRPSVSKSHSFGGYGGPPPSGGPLARGDSINSTKSAGPRLFSKQDSIGSTNTPWRLSPSSSGYKTQTQSLRSDSVTPSPTGCGSDDHTPEPSVIHVVHDTISSSASSASCGVVWAVTDMASVPRGSVLINPQTLQPIVNQDGSIYHFDPSNLPPSQSVPSAMYNNTKSIGINTAVHRKKNEKLRGVGRGGNELHNTVTSGSDISNSNCGGGNNVTGNQTSGTEGSIETLSESSSAQTVVVNSFNRDDITTTVVIDNDAQEITKENHCHREMSDIQEETICNSLDENDKLATNSNEHLNNMQQQKPKVKNQATSPNIPSPEPEEIQQVNEVTNTTSIEISTSLGTEQQQTSNNSSTTIAVINSTSSSPPSGGGGSVGNGVISSSSSTAEHQHTIRKDTSEHSSKITPQSSSGPLMTYAHSYQSVDGSTIFQQPASSGPYPATTYQQGPDGSVYAVPQPMVYAYPPPMEGEIQGYFMPVFDQSAQRDANGALLPTTAQAIYQPTGGATTAATAVVPVAAYPTAPYGSTPIYQGQVVYSPATADQYTPTAASATGQMQQYPMTYPVGYPYPYNGYWGQAMTYYVPQPIPGNAVSSSMIPPPLTAATPIAATATNGGNNSINVVSSSTCGNNTNGNGGNKRNSPPQQNLSNGQNNQSVSTTAAAVAANTTYQFAPGVPLALASDPNGQTMYAIPQSAAAVFPNMLPYGHPSTPSAAAAAGVLTPLPHQPNAVISSLISHPTGPNGPHIPLEPPSAAACAANYAAAISNASVSGTNYGTNSGGTPQSTPSTPLSTNVSTNIVLPPQMRGNHPPALFATPSIIPNGYTTTNSQLHNHHHYHQVDSPNAGTAATNSSSSYDKKNGGGGNGNNKKNNSNYSSNNRQNSSAYSHNQQQNSRKQQPNTNENSNSSNNSQQNSSRQQMHNNHSSQQQQQKQRSNEKQNSGGMSGGLVNSNICAQNNNNSDKSRSGGGSGNMRPKPGNLDLRRNATSQRNSPSTNSIESSNNSPNSIAGSNHNASHDYSQQSIYMTTRGAHHIQPMHPPSAAAVVAAAAAAAVANDPTTCHQPLIGAYNHHPPPPSGMYIKYGQAYFAHPSVALPSNRRSPPNDLRPPIAPLTGVYPAVNMMLPAPRQLQPRHPNPNYKGNKPSR